MILLTVQGQTYNLDYLVKYVSHVGESEVASADVMRSEPVFESYRYLELVFADGVRVTLDKVQSEAFLAYVGRNSLSLDLDRVEELAVGHVVVHDTAEGGDIVFQTAEEAAAEVRPVSMDFEPPERSEESAGG